MTLLHVVHFMFVSYAHTQGASSSCCHTATAGSEKKDPLSVVRRVGGTELRKAAEAAAWQE